MSHFKAVCIGLYLTHFAASLLTAGLLGSTTVGYAAIDSQGFVYVAGNASLDLPATPKALISTPPVNCHLGSCTHGFVAKVSPNGTEVIWATFAPVTESIRFPPGFVIAGATSSTNLFSKPGFQSKPASLFIAKIDAGGSALVAGPYFGGDATDSIATIKIDPLGSVYVAGDAVSSAFPTTPDAYQTQRETGFRRQSIQRCVLTIPDLASCTDQFAASSIHHS